MTQRSSLRQWCVILAALILLTATERPAATAEGKPLVAPPFPDALAGAAIRIDKLGNKPAVTMSTEGVVVGNGDINAIVYTSDNDIVLRVSKNDVWDGRLDTSEDPALPRVDPATHRLHREKPGNPPSWNKPYPCGVPCGEIRLSGAGATDRWTVDLNLGTAAARVASRDDRTVVRALHGGNVFLFEGPRAVRLLGVAQKFLPAATTGRGADGVQWLRQEIPGDADLPGIEVYLVSAGEGSWRAVAAATSSEAPDPFARATRMARDALASPQQAVAAHERGWNAFWSRSGVRLANARLERWWYRMVYYFRCFSGPNATAAAGLKSSFDGLAGWHNSYKFNYNIQQTYCAAGPINHPELADPLIEVLRAYWPRARWFARHGFVGCEEGAFVHSDVFHPREPDPVNSQARNQRQFAYIPWGYSLGMQGHIAWLLWERYEYAPDVARLRDKLYPLLRDIALFYCSFIEKCAKDEQGKYIIGPSYIPENHYFGQDNTTYDLPFIACGLKAAKAAAQLLKTDAALVERIDAILARIPPYPTYPDPAQGNEPIVTYYRGARLPDDDRHGSLIMAVFPAGEVHWFSPPEEKELFRRSINLVGRITTHANSPVTLAIARARLSLTQESLDNIAIDFTEHHKEQPNGLFSWKGHGTFITEQVAVSRMICELLLQSVDGTIRLFPAWPQDRDAAFVGLRTVGGFVVSARLTGGTIAAVEAQSTAGGTIRLVNPWPDAHVVVREQTSGATIPVTEVNGVLLFPTTRDGRYGLNKRS